MKYNPATDRILLGCQRLQAEEPGIPKTYRQMAKACQCSIARIQQIEIKALQKLNRRPGGIKAKGNFL